MQVPEFANGSIPGEVLERAMPVPSYKYIYIYMYGHVSEQVPSG